MRAILCTELGGPEKLSFGEAPAPAMIERGVRIAVRAAGVNFSDSLVIAGTYQVRPSLPFIPGHEVAGIVRDCAPGVTRCRPGDRVMAVLDHGGFAEEAVAREDDVIVLPSGVDFETGAGFAVAYGTSHIALRRRAGLGPGETLVVHGAAGGIGLTAVEIGKALGAIVIATAGGPEKLAIAKAHGADHGVDYSREDIRERVKALTDGRGANVIFDPVGGDAFDASLRCIAWEGRILVVGFAGGRIPQIPANILLVKNVAAIGVNLGDYRKKDPAGLRASFEELLRWLAEGRLKPLVSGRFDLAQAPLAIAELTGRRATGKIIITIGAV